MSSSPLPNSRLRRLLAVTAMSLVAMAGLAGAASAATWSPLGHKFSVTTPGTNAITFHPPGLGGDYTCDLSFGGTIPAAPSSTVELAPEIAVSGCTNSVFSPSGMTVEGSFTKLGSKKLLLIANSTTSIRLRGDSEIGFILKLKTPEGVTACTTLMTFSSLTTAITGAYSNATRTFSFTGQPGTFQNSPGSSWYCPSSSNEKPSEKGSFTANGSMYFTDLFNNGPVTLVP